MPDSKQNQENPVSLFRGAEGRTRKDVEALPSGKLRMIVTHLEMKKSPRYGHRSHRSEQLSIIRSHDPNVKFYRYLYDAVGEPWMWYERKQMNDQELEEIIKNPKVRIYVLYVSGTPAGYSELDLRVDNEIEIAYFGLTPEFIGRGLGRYFLEWTVETAWLEKPERVWVHTCNFDSPSAMDTYQKAGFNPYLQEEVIIDDPRNRLTGVTADF